MYFNLLNKFLTKTFLIMQKFITLVILLAFNCQLSIINCIASDSVKHVKTGFSFGALPAVAYGSDIGFKYGALANFYLYGDGSTYPKYLHSFYVEWHQTTKGSGLKQFVYDSEYLIPKIRLTAEASHFTEKNLDFYGFNGYRAWYDPDFIETEKNGDPISPDKFFSRVFYSHERKVLRLRSDFQGQIIGKKFRWLAGYEFNQFKVATVDIGKLKKKDEDEKKYPDVPLLYDKFVEWGVIPEEEAKGGNHNMFKIGLVYDTRDNEPNPMRGMWSEIIFLASPSFGGKEKSFNKLVLTHRHYFTLAPEVLNLAVRLSYQPKIGKNSIPFYALPYVYSTNINILRDGLGGAKTMRGILRNRIVGEDLFFGNVELRWKFLQIYKKNYIYLALSPFLDFGQVTGEYEFKPNAKYDAETDIRLKDWFTKGDKKDSMHFSYGAGISVAFNHNFVVHVNYGLAAKEQDGKSGLYIGLNFLY